MSARLMNALATLAQCKMLGPLFTVCETQNQISTKKLARYLETVGDRLKDCAFEARMGYDATEAVRIKAEAERNQFRAELAALKAQQVGQEPVAWRYTSSLRVGGKWHYQETFPKWDDRKVHEIGQVQALYTAPQPAPDHFEDALGMVEQSAPVDGPLPQKP